MTGGQAWALRHSVDMSPGGHLLTTAAVCAVTHTLGAPWSLTAAVAAGGFLIDLDHVVDYVVFEDRRALTPGAFLRHYVEGRMRRTVLMLHSYELVALLGLLAWWTESVTLFGYLGGAVMHLVLDLIWNGRLTPHSIVAFYSFAYRAAHHFDGQQLLGRPNFAPGGAFWADFFRGTRLAPGPDTPVNTARSTTPTRPLANLPS